jgi:hypothetical protein
MKLLYQGMKKVKKILWSEKVPFGYEKKPVFENFPFHTLGYENFGCFFLMLRCGDCHSSCSVTISRGAAGAYLSRIYRLERCIVW